MKKGNKRNPLGVLATQRAKRRRHFFLTKFGKTILGLSAILVIIFATILASRSLVRSEMVAAKMANLRHRLSPAEIDWQISIQSKKGESVSDELANAVAAAAKPILNQGSRAELAQLSRRLLQVAPIEEAEAVRTGQGTVVVKITAREAVMVIRADKLRYISRSGVVYGEAREVESASETENQNRGQPLPILSGIFDNRSQGFSNTEFSTLQTTDEENRVITEALELSRIGSQAGFALKTLEFKRFRGFFAIFSNIPTEVALGRAPFMEKFSRLRDILNRLGKNGTTAARIELDYQGKAFIKEKKM